MVGLEELYIRLAGCWVAGANLLVFEVYVEEAVEVEGEAAAGLDAAGMSAREAEVEVDGCVSLACQEASSARAHEATGELARRSAAHRWGRSVGSVTIQY